MLSSKFGMLKTTRNVFSALVRTYSSASSERIIKSAAPNVLVPEGSFTNTVFKDVDKWSMKPAIECSETGVRFTYSELLDQINKWSAFLKSFGSEPQYPITFISANCLQFVPIFFGTISLGIPVSPINLSNLNSNEMRVQILTLGTKFIVYSREIEDTLLLSLKEDISKFHLFCIGKSMKLKAQNVDDILYGRQSATFSHSSQISGKETACIPFSSGTSGPPKAVELTHNAFSNSIYSFTNPYHNLTWKPDGLDQTTLLGVSPFFHLGGLVAILSFGLFTGGKTVIFSNFTPDVFIDGIRKHKINFALLPPYMLNYLNASDRCTEEDLQSLHTLLSGAAPVLRSTVDAFKKKFKLDIDILEVYGMTEILVSNLMPRSCKNSHGCGRLVSNVEAKIICTETGETLGSYQNGEICIKTPSVMKGYLNNQKATDDTLKNGWIHTGDIGHYDEDEFFYVTDRIKDLIKVQSMQISPTEIETELQKHPLVKECSVIGKPDDEYGELPLAFVIPKEEVSEEELQNFLKDKLSKYKQLRGGVKFVNSLPKSQAGKIIRKELQKLI